MLLLIYDVMCVFAGMLLILGVLYTPFLIAFFSQWQTVLLVYAIAVLIFTFIFSVLLRVSQEGEAF